MTNIILSVLTEQVTNIDSKYKVMLVWDHDNAREIGVLMVEKDTKVDPDALQFRDVNLHEITISSKSVLTNQEVIVIDESGELSSGRLNTHKHDK